MSEPVPPSLHESLDRLGERLARIGATATRVLELTPQVRHGVPPSELLGLTVRLERELALATHDLDQVQERAALELESTGHAARPQ